MAKIDPDKNQPLPVTGRTPWDAAVEISKTLGTLVPVILIAAGAVFTVYKFQELSRAAAKEMEAARLQASQHFQTELESANKVVRETYTQMGQLSKQQIENVQLLLALHSDVVKNTEIQRGNLTKYQEEAKKEMERADMSKKESDAARSTAEVHRNQAEESRKELQNIIKQVTTLKAETFTLENRLKEQQTNVVVRTEDINELKNKLQELARKVLFDDPEIHTIAQMIIKDYENPSMLLENYAFNPTSENIDILKRLIGVEENVLQELLQKSMGYKLFVKITTKDRRIGYLGVINQDVNIYKDMIFLQTDKGRVTNIRGMQFIAAVQAQDWDDWYKLAIYLIGEDEFEKMKSPGRTWTLASVEEDAEVETLVGQEVQHKYLSLEEFAAKYPALYDQVFTPKSREREHMLEMLLRMVTRSKKFEVSTLRDAGLDRIPEGLREQFTEVMNVAVQHDLNRAKNLLTPLLESEKVLGMVAAWVLRDSFQVVSTEIRRGPEIVQQQVSSNLETSAEVVTKTRFSRYRDEKAKFRFRKPSDESGWVLSAVERQGPE